MLHHFASASSSARAQPAGTAREDDSEYDSEYDSYDSSADSDSNSDESRSRKRPLQKIAQKQQQQTSSEQRRQLKRRNNSILRPIYEDYMPHSPTSDQASVDSDAEQGRQQQQQQQHGHRGAPVEGAAGGGSDSSSAEADYRKDRRNQRLADAKRELVLEVLKELNAGGKKTKTDRNVGSKAVPKESVQHPKGVRKSKPTGKATPATSYSTVSAGVPAKLRKSIAAIAKQLSAVERKFVDLTGELGLHQ